MAELGKVSPNRMELLKNKRRLSLAQRGHKLLKDKYDELIRRFLIFIRENKELRASTEKNVHLMYEKFTFLRVEKRAGILEPLLELKPIDLEIDYTTNKILNTKVPIFNAAIKVRENYPDLNTPFAYKRFIDQFSETTRQLIELAEHEQTIRLLAAEIERTRRRVNALEHILIPSLLSNIRFISLKMDEIDRENRTRLMKTKEILTKSVV